MSKPFNPVRIPTRPRIVQITACGHDNTMLTQCDCTLFALDDKGRVWSMGNTDTSWRQLPELPIETEVKP